MEEGYLGLIWSFPDSLHGCKANGKWEWEQKKYRGKLTVHEILPVHMLLDVSVRLISDLWRHHASLFAIVSCMYWEDWGSLQNGFVCLIAVIKHYAIGKMAARRPIELRSRQCHVVEMSCGKTGEMCRCEQVKGDLVNLQTYALCPNPWHTMCSLPAPNPLRVTCSSPIGGF